MKEKFYFCFSFNKMTLLNNVQENLVASTEFQLQVLKSKLETTKIRTIVGTPTLLPADRMLKESYPFIMSQFRWSLTLLPTKIRTTIAKLDCWKSYLGEKESSVATNSY